MFLKSRSLSEKLMLQFNIIKAVKHITILSIRFTAKKKILIARDAG